MVHASPYVVPGYYQMVQFMGDPHNHSTLDTNDLEVNVRNDKERTPLMLCFTPPSATVSFSSFYELFSMPLISGVG